MNYVATYRLRNVAPYLKDKNILKMQLMTNYANQKAYSKKRGSIMGGKNMHTQECLIGTEPQGLRHVGV